MSRHIKIVQHNMDRARNCADELRVSCARGDWQVALLQEPYSHQRAVVGLGPVRLFVGGGEGPPMTAIAVADNRLSVALLSRFSNSHIVVVVIDNVGPRPLYLASVYCQYSGSMDPHIRDIELVCTELSGKDLIIGMDANARSRMWFSHLFDQSDGVGGTLRRHWIRGEELETVIRDKDLVVINSFSSEPTYSGVAGGTSNIDVTLATARIGRRVRNWTIDPALTSSQHAAIRFVLDSSVSARFTVPCRFNDAKANWDKFGEVLEELCRSTEFPVIRTKEDLNLAVDRVEKMLLAAASESMPIRKAKPVHLPWWTPRLERLRREVARLKRVARRRRRGGSPVDPVISEEYRSVRRTYTNEVRRARVTDWRRFVTEEGEGSPWGTPYKVAMYREPPFQMATLRADDSITWQGAALNLLMKLFPDDSADGETPQQEEMREALVPPSHVQVDMPGGAFRERVSVGMLEGLVRSFKPGKAPGMDRIEVRILQRAWPLVFPWYHNIVVKCFELGVFPSSWKVGRVCILKKSGDRDPADPKAYRPLCLLSVPGKLLEKVMVESLEGILSFGSPRQYGFVKGRSTVEAILKMYHEVEAANSKYVLGLFVDIRGAFDNVWWPAVMEEVGLRGCPPEIYRLLLDYFRDRKVVYAEGGRRVEKSISKGCPQGSVLGPRLWNLLFDRVLRALTEAGGNVIAYADDLLLLVKADSRSGVEQEATRLAQILVGSCKELKLTIATEKTVMMFLKGRLVDRVPIVSVEGQRLQYVRKFRYLGITFRERLDMTSHVQEVGERALDAFGKVARLAGSSWGIGYPELVVIYKGLFLGILLYGVQAWAHKLTKKNWDKLGSCQRKALLKVNRAYRTSPTCAMPVLAGVLPVRLEAWRRWATYRIKRRMPFSVPQVMEWQPDGEGASPVGEVIGGLWEALLDAWQAEWDEAPKGRLTHRMLPRVRERLDKKWLLPTHELTQFIVGHGEFLAKLRQLGLSERSACPCGEEEWADHVLFSCRLWTQQRRDCGLEGRAASNILHNFDTVSRLRRFACAVLPELKHIHHTGGL